MKKQFLREHHNRQEKTWKVKGNGGYYGGLIASGKPKVWDDVLHIDWSTNPPRSRWKKKYNEKVDKQEHKAEIVSWFRSELKKMRFLVKGYKFKFDYSLQDFARTNNLERGKAKGIFAEVKKDADERYEIVDLRLQRASLEFGYELLENGRYEKVAKVEFEWQNILLPDSTYSTHH